MNKTNKSLKNNKSNTGPVVLFQGQQGSGKGTQAKLLVEKYGFALIEMGALLRAEIARKTKLAKEAKFYMDQGKLVPHWMPVQLLKDELGRVSKEKPIIIDGAPRQVIEAKKHLSNIKKSGRDINVIIYITLTDKESLKRLLLRGRHDDTPEAIKKRLAWSKDKIHKVLKYYSERGYKVEKVNGEQTVKQVHNDILKILKKHSIL